LRHHEVCRVQHHGRCGEEIRIVANVLVRDHNPFPLGRQHPGTDPSDLPIRALRRLDLQMAKRAEDVMRSGADDAAGAVHHDHLDTAAVDCF
jgi:hypothetical protein